MTCRTMYILILLLLLGAAGSGCDGDARVPPTPRSGAASPPPSVAPTETARPDATRPATPSRATVIAATVTPSQVAEATATQPPADTPTPPAVATPTDTPLPASPVVPTGPQFVDGPDCLGIGRAPLPTRRVLVQGNGRQAALVAEVASTPSQRGQGLMCRAQVPPGTGMLFTYDAPSAGGYWMYNTYVPLDIIYIGEQGRAVHSGMMSPCPRRDGEDHAAWNGRCGAESSAYVSPSPFNATLELPAGWLAANGLGGPGSAGLTVILD